MREREKERERDCQKGDKGEGRNTLVKKEMEGSRKEAREGWAKGKGEHM